MTNQHTFPSADWDWQVGSFATVLHVCGGGKRRVGEEGGRDMNLYSILFFLLFIFDFFWVLLLCCFVFRTESYSATKVDLELVAILLPLTPKCWDYNHKTATPHFLCVPSIFTHTQSQWPHLTHLEESFLTVLQQAYPEFPLMSYS
jgi:hypothetical protein